MPFQVMVASNVGMSGHDGIKWRHDRDPAAVKMHEKEQIVLAHVIISIISIFE